MKLEQYISQEDLTHDQFAKLVNTSQATITRYLSGQRFPSREMMRRISEVTNGAVTVSDWFDMLSEAAE